ncbi:MAG: hypothetical protein ACTSVI_08765 [Promethearchaeota archaeon]
MKISKRKGYDSKILQFSGLLLIMVFFSSLIVSFYLLFNNPPRYHVNPPYFETSPREMKMGTYIYDHSKIASHPEYMDDLAMMVDRVLVDMSWGTMMKNSSYPNCFNLDQYAFYDQFFQNLSSRGLGIVIQFSPTRSPPSWLNVSLDMDGYRANSPPSDPVERAFFKTMLEYYVNYTVNFFNNKTYFVELEYCLADEPHAADWADVFQVMYSTIKASSNTTVSIVLNNPDLYKDFTNYLDLITIDPYGNDHENVLKIKKAHEAVNFSKPVRIIISGMKSSQGHDYQRIYRQMYISWFTGGYDFWFWAYNSRWDGLTNDWYVVLYSENGPVHTERADAIINVRQDLKFLSMMDKYIKTGTDENLVLKIKGMEEQAYKLVMQNNFPSARTLLFDAYFLIRDKI